ncbi:HdaA/DnaA family protein [Candidatus Pelagibacter sp.]|uniref:HdaA/DnaA family protein n=1 Tax=Candidatus Pelagibacter sp. TaxID=2024849 RepID=UPI003F85F0D2
MRDLDQTVIKFDHDKNFKNEDFYLSKSNKHVFDFLNKWPKWERNFINVSGEKLSGKTHLMNIFLQKNKGIKFEGKSLQNDDLKKIKIYENIVIENLSSEVNEKLLYSLFNLVEQDNKFIIITSTKSIVNIPFDLKDLKSRAKNFILLNIEKPDDELIFAIILKNLSDRQISLDDKFIGFIIKRIERSYSKIYDFIYKIDQLSLKKKKSIDFKIIKEVLGE